VPLTHQTIRGTNIPSYSDAIQLKSYRFPGFSEVKNNDVVVFNYPPEDQFPADLRTNYIKRCIGIAGNKIEIRNMEVFVNGKRVADPVKMQYSYLLTTTQVLNTKFFQNYNINLDEVQQGNGFYLINTNP
jgi:signal peptidase I